MWRFLYVNAMAAALAAPLAAAGPAGLDSAQLARIPVRLKAYVDRSELPGVVMLVARHGKTGLHEAVGWQDIESRKPMRPDSIFQVMSMTKPVVAAGIMLLVEEGRVALNDPVEKYLPEFRGQMRVAARDGGPLTLMKPARPITIRDLLTHTSGLPNRPPPGLAELYTAMDRTLAEAVAVFAQAPLEFEPGTKWLYSNPGIATLGRIIEVSSGVAFEKFLEQRIFTPLGMKDSFVFPPADKLERIATVYVNEGEKLKPAPDTILGGDSRKYRRGAKYSAPEFGLYSTAADLASFYETMRAGGVSPGGKRLMSRAGVEVMTSLHTGEIQAGHLPGTGFGLAWEVVKEPLGMLTLLSAGSYGHGGAFGTHGWIDPKKDLVGVFLVQHASYRGNAKAVFMAMTGAAAE